ncbi:uncharacterized protein N7511_003570 [Penicillium nucicola]|uniref:uncharacterized protein n=1 Tax=Penicillium nucicola TaxID=1850975 RepID=UPI002544DD54|nr:uncharacterized protein N7511_003570 [Penicillium nucicola]KAJ5771519.1 hypothetical protein N7511_003570 [Penicillium nucicola]
MIPTYLEQHHCKTNRRKFIDTVDNLLLEGDVSHLVKRGSREKCGPKLADSDNTKRSVGFILFERNVTTLDKRMELPKRSMGLFYDKEFVRLTERVVPHDSASRAEYMSTGVMTTFASLPQDKVYSNGGQLSGCTTLYVISRKGVYAVHWWENVSFDPDLVWRRPRTQTTEDIFQKTVLDMLTNGGRYHPKLDASLIEDNWIRAYLLHPTEAWNADEGGQPYTAQWEMIRTHVGQLIPTLQDQSRWKDIPYEALDDEDPRLRMLKATAGRYLFKYDPAHIIGRRQTAQLAMLWFEDDKNRYHKDQW